MSQISQVVNLKTLKVTRFWLPIMFVLVTGGLLVVIIFAALVYQVIYLNRIYPGVVAAGVEAGGMTEAELDQMVVDDPANGWLTAAGQLAAAECLSSELPTGGPEGRIVVPEDTSGTLAEQLEAFLGQWRQSHQALVELESSLRRIEDNPQTFGQDFTRFYNDFLDYYNSETWVDEESMIRAVVNLRDEVPP